MALPPALAVVPCDVVAAETTAKHHQQLTREAEESVRNAGAAAIDIDVETGDLAFRDGVALAGEIVANEGSHGERIAVGNDDVSLLAVVEPTKDNGSAQILHNPNNIPGVLIGSEARHEHHGPKPMPVQEDQPLTNSDKPAGESSFPRANNVAQAPLSGSKTHAGGQHRIDAAESNLFLAKSAALGDGIAAVALASTSSFPALSSDSSARTGIVVDTAGQPFESTSTFAISSDNTSIGGDVVRSTSLPDFKHQPELGGSEVYDNDFAASSKITGDSAAERMPSASLLAPPTAELEAASTVVGPSSALRIVGAEQSPVDAHFVDTFGKGVGAILPASAMSSDAGKGPPANSQSVSSPAGAGKPQEKEVLVSGTSKTIVASTSSFPAMLSDFGTSPAERRSSLRVDETAVPTTLGANKPSHTENRAKIEETSVAKELSSHSGSVLDVGGGGIDSADDDDGYF